MAWAFKQGGAWTEIFGDATIGGITYPAGWADGASDAERDAAGVALIVEASAPDPNAGVLTGATELVDTSAGPARRYVVTPYTIAQAASIMWDRAKAYRDAKCAGGCSTPSGRVDTSDSSKIDIAGAVQMALLAKTAGQPFSLDWTMEDNTIQTLDADGMIALGIAVGQFRAACQMAGTAIREKITQAAAKPSATVDQVFAISIDTDYPE